MVRLSRVRFDNLGIERADFLSLSNNINKKAEFPAFLSFILELCKTVNVTITIFASYPFFLL